jgi:excisionase family DNA binding protein
MAPTAKREPRYARLKQAADYLGGVHPRTIRRMVSTGRIHGYKTSERLFLVDLNEIDEALTPVPTAGGGPNVACHGATAPPVRKRRHHNYRSPHQRTKRIAKE